MEIKKFQYFHEEVRFVIEQNLDNPDFDIIYLSRLIGLSRSQLYRKIKKSTDLSISSYIRQIRLEASVELLNSTDWNISEIANAVGFNSASYFTASFKEAYGYTPKENRR